MTAPLLRVRDLHKTYRGGVQAMVDISFDIAPGTTLGLVGESGSGKSSLARSVLRLQKVDSGEIEFDGQDLLAARGAGLRALQSRLQFVPQNPHSSLNPRLTVGESVAFPLRALAMGARERDARVAEVLDAVGIAADYARRYPHELSGGQAQRVSIARALATRPLLVVCDEAVSALDKSIQAQVLNLLADLQRMTGTAYLFISHDLAVVEHLADEVVVMQRGRVVESGPAARIWNAPEHPYTRDLIAAIPGSRSSATSPDVGLR